MNNVDIGGLAAATSNCHITSTSIPVAKHARYGRNLRVNLITAFHKLRPGIYALSDCDDNGALTIKYVIIEVKNQNNIVTYACSCGKGNCLHVNELKILPDNFK